jgi:hypothetical protein
MRSWWSKEILLHQRTKRKMKYPINHQFERTSKRAGGKKGVVGGGEKGAGASLAVTKAADCTALNMNWPFEARKCCMRPGCWPLGAAKERCLLSGGDGATTRGRFFCGARGAWLISATAGAGAKGSAAGASALFNCSLAFTAIAKLARLVNQIT